MVKPLFIWQDKKLKRIDPQMVVGLFTVKNYTKILLSDHSFYEVRSSLSSALKKFPSELFIRLDRTTAVSVYLIDDIDRDHLNFGDPSKKIELEALPIGKGFYKSIISKLDIIE